jgi:non-ribosomal peptide synthetase component F/aryl carrier-like protein
VVRLFAATADWYHFAETDVWTMFHSYAFDFSVWELWGALLYGGRLVLVPYWVSRSPDAFYELLSREQVSVLNQTPSAFQQLMRAEESAETAAGLQLRLVIFGGEALEPQSLQPWFKRHGAERPQLVNMYGITETTVHVTYRALQAADAASGGGSQIGRPLGDLQAYVLDQWGGLAPVGVAGELYIGGAGLARGYWQRAELTAERFLPDPFSVAPGQRLYRTGDLVRYLEAGELEYLGRLDQQVKVRGHRIELGEIEEVLGQHEGVRQSVVMAREDVPGQKQLVAYVVSEGEAAVSAEELRSHLGEQLPEYMVPAFFVGLAELPLTPNGKVDRRALPAPEHTRAQSAESYVAAVTPAEQALAEIWCEVLGLEQVGVHDNFFHLGGDSIRSIQVRARAQKLGLEFSIVELFEHQTIQELAQVLTTTAAGSVSTAQTQPFSLITEPDRLLLPPGIVDAYPLARLQSGMLFHSQYSTETAIYHDLFSFHLEMPLQVEALQQAIDRLVARHPVLRTSFALNHYSEPLQLVHEQVVARLQVQDLRQLDPEEQERQLAEWMESEKRNHFDLARVPLLRFQVYRRSEQTFQFTLSFHHAILDGWSVATMLTELFRSYLSVVDGKERLEEESPASTFREFVWLERESLQSEETERYWREKLAEASFVKVPRWNAEQSAAPQIADLEVPISLELSDCLKEVGRLTGVPIKSVLLAAHLRVMSLLSGQADVTTGLVTNGRAEEIDGERVLGLFLNTLPLRLKLDGGTWLDLVLETFEAEKELLPHRRYPMAQLQKMLGGQPLFETAFNYIHFHVYETLKDIQGVNVLGVDTFEQTNFTLAVSFSMDTSQIKLRLDYDASQVRAEQVKVFSDYFVKVLALMAAEPTSSYTSQSLLSKPERQQLLIDWNDTGAEFPDQQCIHQLFEQQVERTPEAIALIFEAEQVSYRELNERANQLAHYLRQLGVRPEGRVGICVERSVEMVVGLLGILKAGGAYVPLDAEYPGERLRFMLADAQVEALLTQEQLLARLPEHQARVVCLDRDWEEIGQQSEQNPQSGATADNLAYIIYTSGSTGTPKGVLVQHRELAIYIKLKRKSLTYDRIIESFSSLL